MSRKNLLAASVALGLVIALFSGAAATETRVGTMGGIGFYTHDNSNIFYFPGAIYTYSGQVVGELRVKNNDNSYSVGIHYPLGDYAVVGVYLNRPIPLAIRPNIVQNVTLNHTTDFFYGVQMSQFDLGLRLSIGLDAAKRDVGDDEIKESARYMALGAGISNEGMDLGAFIELPNAKYDTADNSTDWGGFGVGLAGRLFHGETTKLVPVVLLNYRSTSSNYEPGTTSVDYTDMNLGLGVGVNHELNDKNLLVMAVELSRCTKL